MFVWSQGENMLTSVTEFNLSSSAKFLLFRLFVVCFSHLPISSPVTHSIFLLRFLHHLSSNSHSGLIPQAFTKVGLP